MGCFPELFAPVHDLEVHFSSLPKAPVPPATTKPRVVVRHPKFGLGTVKRELGDKLEIAFGAEHGVKVLLARFVEVVEGEGDRGHRHSIDIKPDIVD
jgi:hypothetical protein